MDGLVSQTMDGLGEGMYCPRRVSSLSGLDCLICGLDCLMYGLDCLMCGHDCRICGLDRLICGRDTLTTRPCVRPTALLPALFYLIECESGPRRAVHVSRHKWPGGDHSTVWNLMSSQNLFIDYF